MKTEILKIKGDWQDVVDGCRATVKKPPLGHEPSREFKMGILIAEHEPIREIWIKWRWRGIKYWIAMHWKTHIWPGRTNTQRTDRTGIDRDKLPQDQPVDFEGSANPQHLIDTARKRLCYQAADETRKLEEDKKRSIHEVEPEISDVMVPNCIYRAGCPEMQMCKNRTWPNFVKYCKDHADQHPGLMSIQQRYAWYNEWFERKANDDEA